MEGVFMVRLDGRGNDKIRKVTITRNYIKYPEGSCLIELGNTKDKYRIEKREGEDLRCLNYCICGPHCSYWKSKYGENKND